MLDQNTDRMWYVIGAVLIGAAIIFGMNTLMPEAFASVSDSFTDIAEVAREGVSGLHPYVNDLEGNMIRKRGLVYNMYWHPRTNMLSDGGRHGRDYAAPASIRVDGGETYVFATPNLTYKYIQFYDADGHALFEDRDDFEVGAQIMERIAPENAETVRISARYTYSFDPNDPDADGGDPQSVAPVETWWFGTAEDYTKIDM